MKTVRGLAASLFLGGTLLAIPHLKADPAGSGDADENPAAAANDPDAVPRAFLRPSRQVIPSAAKRDNATAKPDQDWLLHGYEQQMQARALAEGQGDENLYAQLSADKNLAKLAGISNRDASDPAAAGNFLTGTSANKTTLSLRPDSSPGGVKADGPGTKENPAFRPFINPLDATEAAGLHDFFVTIPALSSQAPAAAPAPDAQAGDSGALDIPGMTAAESDPAKGDALDLSLDRLPGEAPVASHDNPNLSLDLPTAHDTDRLQKQQDAALSLPGKRKTIAPVPINPLLLKPPVSDTAAMVPDPPPIRGQVADPYDILR